MDLDREFFAAFPGDGLVVRLAWVDVAAGGEAPGVGVVLARGVAVHQEYEAVADEDGDCDLDPGGHRVTLGANERLWGGRLWVLFVGCPGGLVYVRLVGAGEPGLG
ncbi:hypothetical protein GCM10009554_38020 [Kribbella koreensis]|uniref:Uncharacterized protein n=1 Tax=Kribbella koreensis TaxID=57909 RepID=A0ABN1QLP8_9ACTN